MLYVCTAKGIDQGTGSLMCDILPEGLNRNNISKRNNYIAYLSGPSFAIEIMKDEPMAVCVASYNIIYAKKVQKYLNSTHWRMYISDDVIGVELGGALKNPLAIGAGL